MQYEIRGVSGKPNAILVAGRASNHGNWYEVQDRAGKYQERTHYPVLKNADVSQCVLLYGHQGMPYGSVKGGNLRLNETTRGIEWECELDKRSQAHNDLAVMLERGDATQGSVGMVVGDDKWSKDYQVRDIYGLSELADVTITPRGANPDTASFIAERDARCARVFAMAEAETRAGKVHSAATVGALQAMLKDHKTGVKQLHKGMVQHITDLLSLDGDGTQSGGGGQNSFGGSAPGVGADAAGRSRSRLTQRQRDILDIYAEVLADEERESEEQRAMVKEIVQEARRGF
jgi:phage head maturation protease